MGEPWLQCDTHGAEKRSMIVAMMQPTFMPWQGYFELILKSDRFIFLDDFQFSVQSYHQRNRLFINKGQVGWYTVPIQKLTSFGAPLNKTKIEETIPWRKKMLKRIEANYSKAPFYSEIAPFISSWLLTPAESLAEQNIIFIKFVCELLGVRCEFRLSSENDSKSKRSERVIELLRWCEADFYLCAKGAFEYMLEDNVFPVSDIRVLFQDFEVSSYKQVGTKDNFIPNLSVLDALMNIGPKATAELIQNGTDRWMSWQERAVAKELLGLKEKHI